MSAIYVLHIVALIIYTVRTGVCWILNIQSLWHVILLLNIVASIPDTDACPKVVEMQSIKFKKFKKHHTIVKFVGTVWCDWCILPFTATVKLQTKQQPFCTAFCLSLYIPPQLVAFSTPEKSEWKEINNSILLKMFLMAMQFKGQISRSKGRIIREVELLVNKNDEKDSQKNCHLGIRILDVVTKFPPSSFLFFMLPAYDHTLMRY